MTFPQLEEV